MHVDDRHGDHGAGHRARVEAADHAPDDLDTVDLVAVDRSAEPHGVPSAAPVPHLEGQRDPRAGDLAGDREFTGGRSARRHVEFADSQRRAPRTAHDRLRFFRRTSFGVVHLGTTRPDRRGTDRGVASRPISMRNPISSRRVSVISASTAWPARTRGRAHDRPMVDLARGTPDVPWRSTAASATTASAVERCQGWISKRTHGLAVAVEPLEVERVQRRGAGAGVDLGLEVGDVPARGGRPIAPTENGAIGHAGRTTRSARYTARDRTSLIVDVSDVTRAFPGLPSGRPSDLARCLRNETVIFVRPSAEEGIPMLVLVHRRLRSHPAAADRHRGVVGRSLGHPDADPTGGAPSPTIRRLVAGPSRPPRRQRPGRCPQASARRLGGEDDRTLRHGADLHAG